MSSVSIGTLATRVRASLAKALAVLATRPRS
jgi:hypothetical protein